MQVIGIRFYACRPNGKHITLPVAASWGRGQRDGSGPLSRLLPVPNEMAILRREPPNGGVECRCGRPPPFDNSVIKLTATEMSELLCVESKFVIFSPMYA